LKNPRYSPEVHERAVRMAFESRVEGQSLWSTIESVAAKIGCAPQTLNDWVKQHQRDAGEREGPTRADKKRLAELERENRALRKANEILKLASAFFAQAELDRRLK
jgi:transposase